MIGNRNNSLYTAKLHVYNEYSMHTHYQCKISSIYTQMYFPANTLYTQMYF